MIVFSLEGRDWRRRRDEALGVEEGGDEGHVVVRS